MGTKPDVMTVRLEATKRVRGNRYVICRCGNSLLIGRASKVEDGSLRTAYCASAQCGITVCITK